MLKALFQIYRICPLFKIRFGRDLAPNSEEEEVVVKKKKKKKTTTDELAESVSDLIKIDTKAEKKQEEK